MASGVGDRGAHITRLQNRLNLFRAVNPKLRPDGVYGTQTERAVRQFQTAVGLPVTGYVDDAQTGRAIYELDPNSLAANANLPGTVFPQGTGAQPQQQRNPNVVPRGTRVRLTGNALTVFGSSSIVVLQSALDRLRAAMQQRGYVNVTATSSYSAITVEATLSVDKVNVEGIRDIDFILAGKDAGMSIGNAQFAVVGGGGTPPDLWNQVSPNSPFSFDLSGGTLLLIGGVVFLFIALRD